MAPIVAFHMPELPLHTETMKARMVWDEGPASLGHHSPCFMVVSPPPPVRLFSFFLTFFPFCCGFALFALLFLPSGTLFHSCSLSFSKAGRQEPSCSSSPRSGHLFPPPLLPRPQKLSPNCQPLDLAGTAWGSALVKCTNAPQGQLKMYLVGGDFSP